MTIYVSNMGCHVSCADLYKLFAAIGNVASAHIISSKETGKSPRYGFVEMTDAESAGEAISQLHGKMIEGRAISVVTSRSSSTEQSMFADKHTA